MKKRTLLLAMVCLVPGTRLRAEPGKSEALEGLKRAGEASRAAALAPSCIAAHRSASTAVDGTPARSVVPTRVRADARRAPPSPVRAPLTVRERSRVLAPKAAFRGHSYDPELSYATKTAIVGGIVGGIVGALAGSAVGHTVGAWVGGILGAAAGAWVGYLVGMWADFAASGPWLP